MPTEQTAHLHAATVRRTTATRARASAALRRLNQEGKTINYVTVANAARVSRSLPYRDPELRAEIDRLRNREVTTAPRQPAAERMSPASRDELHETLRCGIKELRRENQTLSRVRLCGRTIESVLKESPTHGKTCIDSGGEEDSDRVERDRW